MASGKKRGGTSRAKMVGMLSRNSPESRNSVDSRSGRGNAVDEAFPPAPLQNRQPPHADSKGRFRPAPFSGPQRKRYIAAVGGAAVVMLAIPSLLNAVMPDRPDPEFATSQAAFSANMTSFHQWPLEFSALDKCKIPDVDSQVGVTKFYCNGFSVTAVGMIKVKDQPKAVDRAIRAINNYDVPSMRPRLWTGSALAINPKLSKDMSTDQVWMTDYYQLTTPHSEGESSNEGHIAPAVPETLESPDPFHDVMLNRTVSLYRTDRDEGDTSRSGKGYGTLVSLQINAQGVDAHRKITADLLGSAHVVDNDAHQDGGDR